MIDVNPYTTLIYERIEELFSLETVTRAKCYLTVMKAAKFTEIRLAILKTSDFSRSSNREPNKLVLLATLIVPHCLEKDHLYARKVFLIS